MKPPGRRTRVIVLLTAVLIGATPFSAGAEDAAIPNPEAIFERARTTLSEMAYPPLLDYRIAVTLHAGGTSRTDHYSGEVEPATGECRVHSFSVEEAANPYVPSGINVYFGLSAGAGSGHNGIGVAPPPEIPIVRKNVNPTPAPVTFGIPDISPLYSFGIRAGGRQLANDDDASTLKTIGRVIVLGRRYNVRLIGRVPLDGVDAYHLGLDPLTDPNRDRLRDLWVGASTYDVLQARIAGNFTDKPASTVPWLIHFVTVGGATYIGTETAEAPLPNTPLTFDEVTISFDDFAPRHGSPDLLFAIPYDLDAHGHVFEPNENAARGLPDRSC